MFITERKKQGAHHLVRAEMEVKQTRQKTFYDSHPYGPMYSEREQVLVFFQP